MDIFLLNTSSGLKPCYDEDYEEKKKLKIGQTYKAKITLARNYELHKKYFALIHCAWAYQNEKTVEHFKHNVDCFRKTVEIAAGYCDTVYNIRLKDWVDIPKSIAFDKMDEFEFRDLYDNVKRVLFTVFLRNISEEEFTKNLINF
ncbi:DUF1367 family protein [uncultured Parabacteroides sp.]|jgi:hypothetical protein|uniref:DUF1367 family protein n=1 Tax=uncultured Parabacteroides sp. TaxID=512312 RepID=UPI0025D81D4D|nr:DUF1367 family protein [uncultured Parabacteroides sp.]